MSFEKKFMLYFSNLNETPISLDFIKSAHLDYKVLFDEFSKRNEHVENVEMWLNEHINNLSFVNNKDGSDYNNFNDIYNSSTVKFELVSDFLNTNNHFNLDIKDSLINIYERSKKDKVLDEIFLKKISLIINYSKQDKVIKELKEKLITEYKLLEMEDKTILYELEV